MKYLLVLLCFFGAWSCSTNSDDDEMASSTILYSSQSSCCGTSSSSLAVGKNVFRIWPVESAFNAKFQVSFSYLDFDSAWLSYSHNPLSSFKIFQQDGEIEPSGPCSKEVCAPENWIKDLGNGFVKVLGNGEFPFPDSTFLRGDTIRYRLGYTLNGKLDSTEWQTYVFLGNHVTYTTLTKDDTIQQFDSIAYPIVLGPNDSCGQAIVAFIYTYSTADTFDYEANWSAMFSDGRTYLRNFNLACPKEAPPLFGKLGVMTYEGDINEAAKAIQKINPVFFLNLKPFCEEYTPCVIPTPQ